MREIREVQSPTGLTVSLWQLLAPLRFSALRAAQRVGVLKTRSMSTDKYVERHVRRLTCTAGTFDHISVD